eukprot:scaffold6576_cov21-Tisochrysis_lutea.AAC.1
MPVSSIQWPDDSCSKVWWPLHACRDMLGCTTSSKQHVTQSLIASTPQPPLNPTLTALLTHLSMLGSSHRHLCLPSNANWGCLELGQQWLKKGEIHCSGAGYYRLATRLLPCWLQPPLGPVSRRSIHNIGHLFVSSRLHNQYMGGDGTARQKRILGWRHVQALYTRKHDDSCKLEAIGEEIYVPTKKPRNMFYSRRSPHSCIMSCSSGTSLPLQGTHSTLNKTSRKG